MAIVKRRIMSRGRVISIMTTRLDYNSDEYEKYSSADRRQAEIDMFFYMIADGKEVKIFNDVDMGGTVVEYDDA